QALDKRMLAVSARKKPLLAFLDEVLVPGGLDFEIKNKTIVIVPRDDRNHSTESVRPVEFRFQQQAYAGTLVDESGQPVPGATLTIQGTAVQTFSDERGRFRLEAAAGSLLVITSIGYTTQEIRLGENRDLQTLTLRTSTYDLDEVSVVAYG